MPSESTVACPRNAKRYQYPDPDEVETSPAEAASVAAAADVALALAVAVALASAVDSDVAIAVAVPCFLLILCVFVQSAESSEPAATVGAACPPAAMRLEIMRDAWSGETVCVLVCVTVPVMMGWVTVTVTVTWPLLSPESDVVGVAEADTELSVEVSVASRPVMPPEAPEASMMEDAVLLLVHCRI